MAIPGFFKQNKPRGFNYVPRYYDPVKEEMEERRRARETESSSAKATEDGAQAEGTDRQRSVSGTGRRVQSSGHGERETVYRSRIMRGDMKNYFHRRNERVQKYTMIRILVIAMIITLVIYLYLRF